MRCVPILLALVAILGTLRVDAAPVAIASPPFVPTALEAVQAARKVMMNDPAAALVIGVDLEHRAMGAPDSRDRRIVLSKAKWIAGEASLRLNRIGDARRLIDASYGFAKASGDAQSEGNSLLSRGSIKSENGDPAGALQDYLTAHRLFLGIADARSQSITLQYLSQLYAVARDFKRAGAYLRQAAEAYHEEPMLQLSLANTMANSLVEQRQYAAAENEYRRGLKIAREMGVHNLELMLLGNLALAKTKQGQLTEAARTVDEALQLARRTGANIDSNLRVTTARLAFAQGNAKLARQILDEIFAAPNGTRTPLDADAEYQAYLIYKAAGAAKEALSHLEVAGRLRNEALALGISTQASLMAAQFDYSTQNLRIAALKATALQRDIALGRQAAARQRMIVAAVAVLVLIVVVALAIWLAALRRSRNQFRGLNARLETANTALEAALQEVGQRAESERNARQLALHDVLTGLPNRRFLGERFLDSLCKPNEPPTDIVVLLLDLDRFKPVNDIHGHEVGDLVLVAIADRLRLFCGRVDAEAVRLGGDEFVVVAGSHCDDDSERLAYEIIADLAAPIYIGDHRLALGASVGIARSPLDGTTIEALLRAADIAMYEAKRSGKERCRFYDPAMKSRQRLRAV